MQVGYHIAGLESKVALILRVFLIGRSGQRHVCEQLFRPVA